MAHAVRLIAGLCLILFLALSVSAQTQPPTWQILVNGEPIQTEVAPFIKEGQTLAPVRPVAEALAASVSWEYKTQSIVVTKQNTVVRFQANNRLVQVGDQLVDLPVAPEIVEERTFVPLQFLAESLGAKVLLDTDKQVINLMPLNYLDGKVNYQLFVENNQVTLLIENISPEPITFNFNTGQEADFTLTKNDQVVWRWSDGRMFTQNTWEHTLQPGKSYVVMANLPPVADGQYTLNAYFFGQPNPKQPVQTISYLVTQNSAQP